MTTILKNNKLEKQLKSIAENLGCFGLENIETASLKIKSLLKDFFPKDKMSFSVTEVWADASPIVIRITSDFARPVWSPEKDPDIINVVKKLGDLGENGSVPPYEPGHR